MLLVRVQPPLKILLPLLTEGFELLKHLPNWAHSKEWRVDAFLLAYSVMAAQDTLNVLVEVQILLGQ